MKTQQILMATTVLAATALIGQRFTNFAGGLAGDGDAALGVANVNCEQGEQAGVSTHGLILVEAGAPVARGAQVQSDGTGRAITLAAGVVNGRAVDAASAAGEFIRVLR